MKKIFFFALAMLAVHFAKAQQSPVKWMYEAKQVSPGVFDLVFTANIQDGWYVYSQYLESDEGPVRTTFTFDENPSVKLEGKNAEAGQKIEGYDDLFGMNIIKFKGQPTFTQRVKVSGTTRLTGYVEFMTCDNERCLPPVEVPFRFDLK